MYLEILVEEPSAAEALSNLIPKILGADVAFSIYPFQGKADLLDNLPNRLRGYSEWLPENYHIVVLVDLDEGNDCHALKAQLEQVARDAGLVTKSSVEEGEQFQVLNRIAIEELEAWFFGDVPAVRAVYPRISEHLGRQAPYRDPDSIAGGTWEALERELQNHGYFPAGMSKIRTAREISQRMNPDRNRSKSFQVFRDGLRALAEQ